MSSCTLITLSRKTLTLAGAYSYLAREGLFDASALAVLLTEQDKRVKINYAIERLMCLPSSHYTRYKLKKGERRRRLDSKMRGTKEGGRSVSDERETFATVLECRNVNINIDMEDVLVYLDGCGDFLMSYTSGVSPPSDGSGESSED